MKKHPCRDCLTISVCKQKDWRRLIRECKILKDYVFCEYDASPPEIDVHDHLQQIYHDKQVSIVRSKISRTFNELYPNTWKPAKTGIAWVWETTVVKK